MQLDGLAEFLAVARAGSFSLAAKRLNVSVSHVSRRISTLETRIGVRLFSRSTRSVRLTDQGVEFHHRCERIHHDIEDAVQAITDTVTDVKGRLRIASVSGSFADRVVAPTLAKFAADHPDLELEVDYNPHRIDLLREGYDFAIRAGRLPDSDLLTRPLAHRTNVAAASPEYLERFGIPQHPNDLTQHRCISPGRTKWPFNIDRKQVDMSVHGKCSFNTASALVEACRAGVGIVYMGSAGFGPSLTDGTLRPILAPYWHTGLSIRFVFPSRTFLPQSARLAMGVLADAAKEEELRERSLIEQLREEGGAV